MEKNFPLSVKKVWEKIKNGFIALIEPIVPFLIRMEINPNALTTMGFGVSIFACYFFAVGSLRLGALLVLTSGIFDIMDGKLARGTNRVTRFGALYDSTLDRYAEIFIFLGIAYYFIGGQLKHSREMSAVLAPTTNSYKRLVPGYEAPVYICWGRRNRSALIRVPEYFIGNEKDMRTELRCPDPSCNPYLAFAVMLKAGLNGIKKKIKLRKL